MMSRIELTPPVSVATLDETMRQLAAANGDGQAARGLDRRSGHTLSILRGEGCRRSATANADADADADAETTGGAARPTLAVSVGGCTVGYRKTNTISVYEVDDDGAWGAASMLGQVNPSTELFPKRWLHTASVINGEVRG